ncbi:putative thioredoxin-like, glutaredoxin, PICOT [Lupinus albus]|uniref:Putative thioredoxin-like, glutaredoxin, PICOT n=1 Tax=Lupinus albus TaxID=3870 RepID=A0A6A4QW85_LUPAL|nr:putative thioredoxin-like, glutaredoxin, PICOT [Lupinus albus]
MSSFLCLSPLQFQPRTPAQSSSSFFHSHVRGTTSATLSLRPSSPLPSTTLSHKLRFHPNLNHTSTTVRCSSALTPELKSTLDKVVSSNKVVLFMKGTKDFPQCGFSNTVVQILKSQNVAFETINILENELLRQGLKEYSNWPTFPQLYIEGEFFGGCDITVGIPEWTIAGAVGEGNVQLKCQLLRADRGMRTSQASN